jgi:hypothetical protein
MTGGKVLDQIEIVLRDTKNKKYLPIYINVFDNSLSQKWLAALNQLLMNNYHLEKNYCFFGFVGRDRDGEYLLDQVNRSIAAINSADLGYDIDDYFTLANTISDEPEPGHELGRNIIHDRFNWLHRYFEDLQGTSGSLSQYYLKADATTRWHIRQLNLLCHEFESWALSYRKQVEAPEWQRVSQIMCWLNAPRFTLDEADYELFGIETMNRPLGGVFVGVNKAVGKHHWEVFNDEGRDSRISELTTTVLKNQTEAAGDFDIEWAQNPGEFDWMKQELADFRSWLVANGFDPNDKSLTIGHPQVGQVDLRRSFATEDYRYIWYTLSNHLDVYSIKTSSASAVYDYHWSDTDFIDKQVAIIKGN